MNCTIESRYTGKRTIVNWVEQLFGYRVIRKNILSKPQVLEAGLAIMFNAMLLESEIGSKTDLPHDIVMHLNCACLLFLLDNIVEPLSRASWLYVKSDTGRRKIFWSPHDDAKIHIPDITLEKIKQLIYIYFADGILLKLSLYLINMEMRFCSCLPYL